MKPRGMRVRAIRRETPWSAVVQLDAGATAFAFKAGQAATLGLPEGEPTAYSVASDPESVRQTRTIDFLVGTTRDGHFGAHLSGLAVGSAVWVTGPFGRFLLPDKVDGRPLVFIAGGTGIAPLRSMMRSVLAGPDVPPMTLLYSAHSHDGFAFVDEFRRWSRAGRVRLSLTATGHAGDGWRGRRGRIRRSWIAPLVRHSDTLAFVCGPPPFVEEVSGLLTAAGVSPDRIMRERY
ncbi:MAG: FAD-dependent oxidoreductase [Acidobacteriota bacterium]